MLHVVMVVVWIANKQLL